MIFLFTDEARLRPKQMHVVSNGGYPWGGPDEDAFDDGMDEEEELEERAGILNMLEKLTANYRDNNRHRIRFGFF